MDVLSTPEKKTKKTFYCDRMVPVRSPSISESFSSYCKASQETSSTYSMILQAELMGRENAPLSSSPSSPTSSPLSLSPPKLFSYQHRSPSTANLASPFSLSPISSTAQHLLSSPPKHPRKIFSTPIKQLDAPGIQDDFYLNLVDWSSTNLLAIALNSSVYVWNASTLQTKKLCEVMGSESVTAVNWSQTGLLAIGTARGSVLLWDLVKDCQVREMAGHNSRVGAIAWNGNIISSGSRDRAIFNRDLRSPQVPAQRLIGHRQEVCGLKWSPDGQQLASGGNDNRLLVWDSTSCSPVIKRAEHLAAVKAIAWSPHQRGLLASGGGTADKHIRFWNTLTNTSLKAVDTLSQVCNLAWSKNVDELVSTHGYSQNQVIVWSYPNMEQMAKLIGHKQRVLYLAVSPDGQTIVTGAGDETLKFWNVFPSAKDGSFTHGPTTSLWKENTIR